MQNPVFNKAKWHLVVAFLFAISGQLSANTQALIKKGKLNPRGGTLAVRQTITAGGTVNLLDQYNSKVKGRNDFDGNKLTQDRNFIIDGITVNFGLSTTADNTPLEMVNYTTALPPGLKSANLVIKQNDDVIRRISISAINEAKSTDERWYFLDGFALLIDDAPTSIEIEFGASATSLGEAGTESAHVEVVLKGFETNVKR